MLSLRESGVLTKYNQGIIEKGSAGKTLTKQETLGTRS